MPMYEDHYEPGGGWVPGVDFDPSDQDEMEVMRLVWEKEKYDRMEQLERENRRLREELLTAQQLKAALIDCEECGKQAVCVNVNAQWFCGSCAYEYMENQ